MRVSDCVGCKAFPCADVEHARYVMPNIDLNPEGVSVVLISEAAPASPAGYYYAFRGTRAFPSYLQAGPSFFIEKSKRRMIAEDIAAALQVAGQARA